MQELGLKDAHATGGGCGCGGHEKGATARAGNGGGCCGGGGNGGGCGCGGQGLAQQAQAPAESTGGAQYTVSGMTCGHCVAAIKEEVGAIPGVTGVDVDLASGAMTITSDAPVAREAVVAAVAEAGDYTVA